MRAEFSVLFNKKRLCFILFPSGINDPKLPGVIKVQAILIKTSFSFDQYKGNSCTGLILFHCGAGIDVTG